MKALGALLQAAFGRPVQSPAIYVQIGFSVTRRWSSFKDAQWNGFAWTARDMDVRDLEVQSYGLSGTLVLGNTDNVAGALALNEGFKDKPIVIWGYDASAPAEPEWLCEAIGGGIQVAGSDVLVALRHPCDGLTSPRTYVNDPSFGSCLPDGAVIRINGLDMRLERGIT